MSQVTFQKIPGLLAVYRLKDDHLEKVYGMDMIRVDLGKLAKILVENMEIGQQEAKKLKLLDPLLGYAMIIDDIGVVVVRDLVYFVRARETNWDYVIKHAISSSGEG
ncbi:hypothetical protein [Stygiolobus caldivivus]|uniref:Uncharacterized protein n=1 Tax=Stygiolobus caldivivus TaxID=2824673 RepID=A0A8D5U7Y1_9CREN|nr:hypothetical protein [Stygiolobus caldivivus]BCU70998.1 hypothetical protein KN1_22950 [Stygiolobus caldivivus]